MPVRFVELAHAKEIGPGKTTQPRLSAREVRSQLGHHPIAPLCSLDFSTDISPDLSVQLNQFGIDCQYHSLSSDNNQLGDFVKTCIRGRSDRTEVIHVRAFLLVGGTLSSTLDFETIKITICVEVKQPHG